VVEEFVLEQSAIRNPQSAIVIEVHLKPGVMDPVADSTEQAIRSMGFNVSSVRTARRYELAGAVSDEQRETIARRLLANAGRGREEGRQGQLSHPLERGDNPPDVVTAAQGAVPAAVMINAQAYFDVHHSALDTVASVHPRELELQAVILAALAYLLAQEGV